MTIVKFNVDKVLLKVLIKTVINGNLMLGCYHDYAGQDNPIPQTMLGVESDVDSDKCQEWC